MQRTVQSVDPRRTLGFVLHVKQARGNEQKSGEHSGKHSQGIDDAVQEVQQVSSPRAQNQHHADRDTS